MADDDVSPIAPVPLYFACELCGEDILDKEQVMIIHHTDGTVGKMLFSYHVACWAIERPLIVAHEDMPVPIDDIPAIIPDPPETA